MVRYEEISIYFEEELLYVIARLTYGVKELSKIYKVQKLLSPSQIG